MTKAVPARKKKSSAVDLPSVDDVKPAEEGGPIARSGFNYQDEIAVSFFIDMLENPVLVKVHCETHDDLVLVFEAGNSGKRVAEFVQVKASKPDKLWSVADLCQRMRGKKGSSLLEASLGRDKHRECSRFRIVTLRPVVSDLEILSLPIGATGREPDSKRITALKKLLKEKMPGLGSTKGNGTEFWVDSCFWDQRHDESSVRNDNLLRVLKLGQAEGKGLLPEPASVLLDELRDLAKTAGAAKWEPDRDAKVISRQQLRAWWENRTSELVDGAASASGGRLTAKMRAANLPPDLIALAVDMRRGYSADFRISRYLEIDEVERLQARVKSEVVSLRARMASGQLGLDGPSFHALCLDRMDAVNDERPAGSMDRSAFLKGCMYDIADRCMLQFVRAQ